MPIIDSQVHAYEANTPKRPWHSVPNWPDHVTGDEMVAAMDKVGVDGAIFISAFSMYQYDASYAVEVPRAHPGRMAIVKPVNPDDPDCGRRRRRVEEDAGHGRHPHHADQGGTSARLIDPGLDRIARAAVRYDFPVNMLCWDNLDAGTALIDRHPDTRFILDHLGILQPRVPPAPPRALGRSAEGARARQAPERRDQGQRRLHAVAAAVSVSGHLGSAGPRVRCLGFRTLPVGHGLDARLRRRQLRAGRQAVPGDGSPERHRTGDADGRRLRQGLWLVAEEKLARRISRLVRRSLKREGGGVIRRLRLKEDGRLRLVNALRSVTIIPIIPAFERT